MKAGLKVVCPLCRRKLFVTTEHYNPDISPNGSMLKFLGGYHIDWLTTSTTKCSELACPECQAQLAPSGRLTVIEEPKTLMETEEAMVEQFAEIDKQDEELAILRELFGECKILPDLPGINIIVSDEVPDNTILVVGDIKAPGSWAKVAKVAKEEADKMETVEFPKTVKLEGIAPKAGKPVFICEVCGKECSTPLALNGHMRSHTKGGK